MHVARLLVPRPDSEDHTIASPAPSRAPWSCTGTSPTWSCRPTWTCSTTASPP